MALNLPLMSNCTTLELDINANQDRCINSTFLIKLGHVFPVVKVLKVGNALYNWNLDVRCLVSVFVQVTC